MKKKQLLLTFDFELFLGEKSGTVENCLLKPTEEILKVLTNHKLSSVFFVDTLYLFRLKEIIEFNNTANEDYKKIINLLRTIISNGGYVFHHLHPHWLDAKYISELNQWDVSNKSKFALSNLNNEEIEFVFFQSNQIILEIYKDLILPKTFGIRAGGLYAQPFSIYKSQMEKYNIFLEFSVLRDAKSTGNKSGYQFDYSIYPSERIFHFSDEVNIKDESGHFKEYTLDQCEIIGFRKILNSIYYRLNHRHDTWKRFGDGISSGNVVSSTKSLNKFKGEESFSIELLNGIKEKIYINYYKKSNFLHLISHPKFFSKMNIKSFDSFLSKVIKKYSIESDVFNID